VWLSLVCILETGPVAELTVCLATIPAVGLLGGYLVVGLLGGSLVAGPYAGFVVEVTALSLACLACKGAPYLKLPIDFHSARSAETVSFGQPTLDRREKLGERQNILDVVWPFV
jgi:hypothetical protein